MRSLARAGPETPKSLKKSSLGFRVLYGLAERSFGHFEMSWAMWVLEKPWFLKSARTESAFVVVVLRLI